MNALTTIRNDYHAIDELFGVYNRSRSLLLKEKVAQRLGEALRLNASITQTVLFPVARQRSIALATLVRRGSEEHQLLGFTLADLEKLLAGPADSFERAQRLDAVVQSLLEFFNQHFSGWKTYLEPALLGALTSAELESVGALLVEGRLFIPR